MPCLLFLFLPLLLQPFLEVDFERGSQDLEFMEGAQRFLIALLLELCAEARALSVISSIGERFELCPRRVCVFAHPPIGSHRSLCRHDRSPLLVSSDSASWHARRIRTPHPGSRRCVRGQAGPAGPPHGADQ